MVKIRLTGTKRDIRWFQKILTRDRRYRVRRFSELFANKSRGTKQYYRMYVNIERNRIEEQER